MLHLTLEIFALKKFYIFVDVIKNVCTVAHGFTWVVKKNREYTILKWDKTFWYKIL